ncbi:NAD-dependent epimerase/dehydratase family protein [Tahibacter harae]|uniref:NAD(P)-dependent oxidoreductase n=1 Tax=Tahibacter harae TaxID=2963937 RepID=A0ABT1QQI2_9GAMM|nr:NAD(P)-dependent oxidoreductase [Tahibacter harae]MCQ4164532.1 NAD(P)-dependent oxidoreductase [Tahibacter harae]
MKVLVTGAAGRIGRAICIRLLPEHEVIGLDRTPASTVQLVGDLSDPLLLRRALREVDAVIHTAALHAPHVGISADSEFERINVQGTELLANMAAGYGARRFIFTSTTALYGAASQQATRAAWVDEELPPRPVSIYHRSKLAAEASLSAAARAGMSVTALRMSRCFPEPAPLMACYRLHRGIDARDVAEAHALALQNELPGLRRYIISGATPFQPEDAEALLHDAPAVLALRAPALVEAFRQRGWRLPRAIDRVYSPALAMRMLAWRPRYGFEEVLRLLDEQSSEVLPPCRE